METFRPPFPWLKRLVLAGFGLCFLALATLDALTREAGFHGLRDLFTSLLFVPAGAGIFLIVAAFLDAEDEWQMTPQGISIVRRTAFSRREFVLHRHDVTDASVVEHDWESRPASYTVEMRSAGGLCFRTPEYATRSEAEARLTAIMSCLA